MKTLNGNKTNLDLLRNCDEALRQFNSGIIAPVVNGVKMEGAAKMGRCQQNTREIVEATAYGKEWMWGEASCCATATNQRLVAHGWQNVTLKGAQPGDLVYFGPGGGKCGTCGQDPGHVGILHHQHPQDPYTWYVWQNTSYNARGLCCIILRDSQRARIVGVYRMFALAELAATGLPNAERRINFRGQWIDPDDIMYDMGVHYINVRRAAAVLGDTVKVGRDGKVYTGPAEWWGEPTP